MSWLTEYVRPRIRTLLGQRPDVPDNLWSQCANCEQMVFTKELEKNQRVCPHCGHHMRGTALERLDWTFAEASFTRIELPKAPADPLTFRDQKRYAERLREARAKTGLEDALVVAHGTIEGARAVVAVMEFNFMGGSMGAAVGSGCGGSWHTRLGQMRGDKIFLVLFFKKGLLACLTYPASPSRPAAPTPYSTACRASTPS